MRAAMMLLAVFAATTAQATDYITDIMVIGGSKEETDALKTAYQNDGWTLDVKDLNAGASGDYIFLLYRTEICDDGYNHGYITDVYIKTGSSAPDELTHNRRTYRLAVCDGGTNFTESHGDLNRGAGGDYIRLYYTRDLFPDNRVLTGIDCNENSSNALGANGGSGGYDLNSGIEGATKHIYMHITTTAAPLPLEPVTVTLTRATGDVLLHDGDILTGTSGRNTHIKIAAGATVTLDGVTVTTAANDTIYYDRNGYEKCKDFPWAGIECLGDATIVLADGSVNVVYAGSYCYPAIQPGPPGTTLTIRGNGFLEAHGASSGAAIGSIGKGDLATVGPGGNITSAGQRGTCGNIVIEGGNITADLTILYTCYDPLIEVTFDRCCITGRSAAIGSGNCGTCGDITIKGGIIKAISHCGGATIGSGAGGTCGNITIDGFGSRLALVAERVDNVHDITPYIIGPGKNWVESTSVCGTLTIDGVQTDYIEENPYIYAPVDPNDTYLVHFDANGGTGTMDDQTFVWNVPQALNACTFIRPGYTPSWNTKADGSGRNYAEQEEVSNLTIDDVAILYAHWDTITYDITYINAEDNTNCVTNPNPKTYDVECQDIIISEPVRVGFTFDGWTYEGQDTPTKNLTIPHGSTGDKTFTAHWSFSPIAIITPETRDAVIYDGRTLVGTGGENTKVVIRDGATVTLNGVTITSIPCDLDHGNWAGITCEGDATLILADGTINDVYGGLQAAGIFIGQGHTLTIKGEGTLNATGPYVGIGGSYGSSIKNGNIIIEGGIINASSSEHGPGIGDPDEPYSSEHGGDITINGGTVTANGFNGSAIGGGMCGNITITGGTVNAIVSGIAANAAGIGSDFHLSSCGNITITGGTVKAIGGGRSPGIGSAEWASCGDITISGGIVVAEGARGAAGIGSGNGRSTCGNITITDGVKSVTATAGGTNASPIGAGNESTCGTVAIDSTLIDVIKGNTRMLYHCLTIAVNADNSEAISQKEDRTCQVTLQDRTLYRDGSWNSLCLPFDINEEEVMGMLGPSSLMTLDETEVMGNTMMLNFEDATSIEAGKPYIIKWNADAPAIGLIPIINPTNDVVAALNFISEVPTFDNGQASDWNAEGEGPAKLIDGDTSTKYGMSEGEPWVEFHYASPFVPKGYALWTAEDTEGTRNPASWIIKAKNSGDADWTTLTIVNNKNDDKLPMANNTRTIFALVNDKAYQYFRFEATKNIIGDFQLAELQFCTVQPDITLSDIVSPLFYDVTISSAINDYVDDNIQFKGTYASIPFTETDRSIIMVGRESKLHYPQAGDCIGACQAYFKLPEGSNIDQFLLNIDCDATVVKNLNLNVNLKEDWFDLNGRKLSGKPTQKGVYINGGRKILR